MSWYYFNGQHTHPAFTESVSPSGPYCMWSCFLNNTHTCFTFTFSCTFRIVKPGWRLSIKLWFFMSFSVLLKMAEKAIWDSSKIADNRGVGQLLSFQWGRCSNNCLELGKKKKKGRQVKYFWLFITVCELKLLLHLRGSLPGLVSLS